MANKHLSLKPHTINDHAWWYEEAQGITLIHEVRDTEEIYIKTEHIGIPWAQIRAALARKDRKEAIRRAKVE